MKCTYQIRASHLKPGDVLIDNGNRYKVDAVETNPRHRLRKVEGDDMLVDVNATGLGFTHHVSWHGSFVIHALITIEVGS